MSSIGFEDLIRILTSMAVRTVCPKLPTFHDKISYAVKQLEHKIKLFSIKTSTITYFGSIVKSVMTSLDESGIFEERRQKVPECCKEICIKPLVWVTWIISERFFVTPGAPCPQKCTSKPSGAAWCCGGERCHSGCFVRGNGCMRSHARVRRERGAPDQSGRCPTQPATQRRTFAAPKAQTLPGKNQRWSMRRKWWRKVPSRRSSAWMQTGCPCPRSQCRSERPRAAAS